MAEENFAEEFEAESGPAPNALEAISAQLDEAIKLKDYIEQTTADLAAATKAFHKLTTGSLVEKMSELQLEEMTRAGWKVKVADFVSGSLPKAEEEKAKAIDWLVSHEAGGLIRTDVAVAFSRSQHNEALALASELKEKGHEVGVNSGVHAQTLQAFARERIRNGEPIDTDVLGLFTGKVAKFTAVKK